jgi:hypothetical protein
LIISLLILAWFLNVWNDSKLEAKRFRLKWASVCKIDSENHRLRFCTNVFERFFQFVNRPESRMGCGSVG